MLAIGLLEESALVETTLDDIAAAASGSARPGARRISPVVGAPWAVLPVGDELLVASTNQAELVRLDGEWKQIQTMDIAGALGRRGIYLGYGSLILRGSTVLISLASGSEIWVVEVDPTAWTILRTHKYPTRFASFPLACFTDNGTLGLLTSKGLDLIDPVTLESRQFVELEGAPAGLACQGDRFWVSDIFRPTGRVISSAGRTVGTFRWEGKGSPNLLWDARAGRVYGSDPAAGRVFACRSDTLGCAVSPAVGKKPTSMLVAAGRLLVLLEDSDGIALLDGATLRVDGVLSLGVKPRTLTLIRPAAS